MIVTLYRTDSRDNPWYYSIHDRQGNLFSQYSFTIVWGSDPGTGREKVIVFDSQEKMDRELRSLLKRKTAQGYRVLYSFSRCRAKRSIFRDIENASAVV